MKWQAIKVTAALCSWVAANPCLADDHAVLMWISKYPSHVTSIGLPGVDEDAKRATRILSSLGVPENRIQRISNDQLTYDGMANALSGLVKRIKSGDRVVIYFSGHGAQRKAVGGAQGKCTEGIMTFNRRLYLDADLREDLDELAQKARQVIMFNDSCFSGGTVTKQWPAPTSNDAYVAKSIGVTDQDDGTAPSSSRACGQASNVIKKMGGELLQRRGQLVYLAASAQSEAAYSTPFGSLATQAWEKCLVSKSADLNQDGKLTAQELQNCSQALIDKTGKTQHLTTVGDPQAVLATLAGP